MKVRAGVIEIANRVSTNVANSGIDGIADDLANHQSGLNANAHIIQNIGGLQSALNGKEPAFSKNNAFNKNFGNTANTVCEGNDSRLSNARTPTAHTHNISDVNGLQAALNNKANTAHNHSVSDVTGLQGVLDSKADKGTVTQTLTVITEVDFINQTVVTANINIVDGIIVQIN